MYIKATLSPFLKPGTGHVNLPKGLFNSYLKLHAHYSKKSQNFSGN